MVVSGEHTRESASFYTFPIWVLGKLKHAEGNQLSVPPDRELVRTQGSLTLGLRVFRETTKLQENPGRGSGLLLPETLWTGRLQGRLDERAEITRRSVLSKEIPGEETPRQ